jgi:hypothetical protein
MDSLNIRFFELFSDKFSNQFCPNSLTNLEKLLELISVTGFQSVGSIYAFKTAI